MEKYNFSPSERSLMENAPVPFAVYQFLDNRVCTLVLSKGFCDLLGYDDPARAYYDMDHDMYKDVHPEDAARIADEAVRFAKQGGSYDVIYRTRNIHAPGYHILHAHGEHVFTDSGIQLAYVWYTDEGEYTSQDDPKQSSLNRLLNKAFPDEKIIKYNYYDHLTGLPNLSRFLELSESRKHAILKAGGTPAIMYFDLRGMKYYNHKYGLAEGDKLLQSFARLLADYFGNESCGRIGQDHFGASAEEAGLEEKLQNLFMDCKKLNNGRSLPVHVGIHLFSMEEVGERMAFDRAKIACDAIGSLYSSYYKYYDLSMRYKDERRQYIIANLDRAIEEKWIQVYYQPIIRAVNNKICNEEALARWVDPVDGILSPGDFIPVLEDAGLIYKLDLYVVDEVIKKLKDQRDLKLHLVPNSINLSRSDFDFVDIVEEIRRRADSAGIDRSLLNIEITESIIGRRFNYMKEQVKRFRKLGFAVWMDDFGSGYSSLDVLQNIQFDLIKFDMHFLRQMDKGESGKIILTEMIRMVSALGIDTLCEGVETKDQADFLLETGCSKLQGFYFGKPIPKDLVFLHIKTGFKFGFENPAESDYFETIGRVNLFDLSVISSESEGEFRNYFNTFPMGIIEINGDDVTIIRSNSTFRRYIKRFFDKDISGTTRLSEDTLEQESTFIDMIKEFSTNESPIFFDMTMTDGSIIHSFAKPVSSNTVTGAIAVGVAILSISDVEHGMTYENIARALAADYFNLFYVDLDTEDFIEYSSTVGEESLSVEHHGTNFFSSARKRAENEIHIEYRDYFINAFRKENVIRELEEQGMFTLIYRLDQEGDPVYVIMKIMRMGSDKNHIVIGVSNIDSQMKQKALLDKMRQNEIAYSRIMALTGDYICMYTVNIDTGLYVEYSSTSDFEGFGIAKSGTDFFADAVANGSSVIVPEDFPEYKRQVTRENMIREISEHGFFSLHYRLMIDGVPHKVNLRAGMVKEGEKNILIVGVNKRGE